MLIKREKLSIGLIVFVVICLIGVTVNIALSGPVWVTILLLCSVPIGGAVLNSSN